MSFYSHTVLYLFKHNVQYSKPVNGRSSLRKYTEATNSVVYLVLLLIDVGMWLECKGIGAIYARLQLALTNTECRPLGI